MCEYDDWKLATPYDDEDKINECRVCGELCEDDFCSRKCYLDDFND